MPNQALEQTRDSVLRYDEVVGCELLDFFIQTKGRMTMNLKTLRFGLILGFGVFVGNLVGVPLIQQGKTIMDGFAIGCIAFVLTIVVYAIIATVQSRKAPF